jgi:hypothetical protein
LGFYPGYLARDRDDDLDLPANVVAGAGMMLALEDAD